jgi:hypothetical protein
LDGRRVVIEMDDLRAMIKAACDEADAVEREYMQWQAQREQLVQRSSDTNLIFKINENAKVESPPQPDLDDSSISTSNLTEEEMEGIGIALGTIRKQMRDHADAIEGRLHAELVSLRDEVKALRAQIESKNVTPLHGKTNVA